MRRLVALDLPGGRKFVDELRRAWDDGDAVLPIDQRFDAATKSGLVRDLGASVVIDESGLAEVESGRPVDEGDALVMATSGTSGVAKGVVLTHDALRASAVASSSALGVGDTDRWLACLPLSHVGGLSVVVRALLTDTPLTVHDGFDADSVMRAASDGCTLVSLVPTTLGRIDPHQFRAILLGGSRPPAERPPHVIATYGLTETGSGIVYDGRPLAGVEISIGEGDEVLVRGPMLMREYRNGTTSIDTDGWLHTGDAGNFSDGLLQVTGRLDDLIKTGGEKVWPDAVEKALTGLVEPHRVCVVGVEDPDWGQVVVLVTTVDLDLSAVKAKVRETLPAFCAPRHIVRVEELPTTAIGKIRRTECIRIATRVLARPS